MSTLYQGDIDKIPSSKFGKVNIKVNGQYQAMQGAKLKQYMKGVIKGGKSLRSVENHFKSKAGLTGSQSSKRQEIIKMLKGDGLSSSQKKAIEKEAHNRIKRNIQSSKAASRLFGGKGEDSLVRANETKFISSGTASALSSKNTSKTSAVETNSRKARFSGGNRSGNAMRRGAAARGTNIASSARGIGSTKKIGLSS